MYNSVILSGLPVAGKGTLAMRLSEIYGWKVHSVGGLWREEWKKRFPNGEVSFHDFWRGTSIDENRQMNVVARDIVAKGRVVADTRFACVYEDLPSLLVFCTADIGVRVARAMQTDRYVGKSADEVREILLAREQDEVRGGREVFNYDYRDVLRYHLVLNTGKLSVEQEVAVVCSFVSSGLKLYQVKYFPGDNEIHMQEKFVVAESPEAAGKLVLSQFPYEHTFQIRSAEEVEVPGVKINLERIVEGA